MRRLILLRHAKSSWVNPDLDDFDRPLHLASSDSGLVPGMSIRDVERTLILKTLEHFDGRRKETAEALGVSLKTLYNRLREYGHGESD